MDYKLEYSKNFCKDFKKLPCELRTTVQEKIIPFLQKNPEYGVILIGPKNRIKRFRFRHKRCDYRIAYQVFKKRLVLLFLAVGPRENFYNRMKNRKLL